MGTPIRTSAAFFLVLALGIVTACAKKDPSAAGEACGEPSIYSENCPFALSCQPRGSIGACEDLKICTKSCDHDVAECAELGADFQCVPACGGKPGKICLRPNQDFVPVADAGSDAG